MINYERVAEKIFAIIKGHGHTLSMYKEDGMDTTDAAEARRFFVSKPNYMITLEEDISTIKINKNSDLALEDLEGIMKQMKNLARENMLNTQVKVFGKEITPKDFAYQAKKFKDKSMDGISEASLSRMTGSKKTSYQTLESVKMVVRHRKAVDEDVRGSRSRQISAIFLEQAGERFRFPHNNLQGARAMARHMYEGGNMQDTVGEYIVESVGNLIQLAEFVRYTRTNKLINETSEDVIKIVKENIAALRGELKGLTGAKSYARISETIAARETNVLEEDETDLQDMFTVRKFDEKFGATLPLVSRLLSEKQAWRAALLEASQQTIFMKEKEDLAEEDIMEFENPVQQVGYKIGKVAKRMVESGDLSKFVAKVADKLIEGAKLSEFEQTIVRNVMENAKVEETNNYRWCVTCGGDTWADECKCKKKDTVEGVSDQFELKMKMIEHEEIFETEYDQKCPDCRGGYTQDGKDCKRCEGSSWIPMDEGWRDTIRDKATGYIDKKLIKQLRIVLDHTANPIEASVAIEMNMDKDYVVRAIGKFLESSPNDPDYDRFKKLHGMLGGKVNEADVGMTSDDEWNSEVARGESEAGAGMGMPMPDYADCPRCNGLGRHPSEGKDCEICNGTGKADYVSGSKQDPFSGNFDLDPEDLMDECPACEGEGNINVGVGGNMTGEYCERCYGQGYV